jgi:glycosyltransferase involved in cell wall biosynthesis
MVRTIAARTIAGSRPAARRPIRRATAGVRSARRQRIIAILPAYNEGRRIGPVVRRCLRQGLDGVIVVDDGSKDDTAKAAKAAGATVLVHIVNLGKGAAMKTGADYAVAHGATGIIFMDSDGQHRPEELPLFAQRLSQGYEIIFGARKRTRTMPLIRRMGNWLITTTVRVFYKMQISDVMSGYRAMTADAYRVVRWKSRDYSVESEMIARAGRNNLHYTEFTIATIYHDKYKGMTPIDGLKLVARLIWWRMTN